MKHFLIAFALALTGCGYVDYNATKAGTFTGSLFVMWVGEGGSSGDGRFLYVPNPRDPLTFVRDNGTSIQPGMMYTDGGSIPRPAQLFTGFSPWGYAPAYMVHDWIFHARQCLNDGSKDPAHEAIETLTFQDSADIIAESIKTLVETGKVQPNDVAPRVISGAVAGPVSYARWTVKGDCYEVSKADKAAAETAIPDGRKSLRRATQAGPARIVATIEF